MPQFFSKDELEELRAASERLVGKYTAGLHGCLPRLDNDKDALGGMGHILPSDTREGLFLEAVEHPGVWRDLKRSRAIRILN